MQASSETILREPTKFQDRQPVSFLPPMSETSAVIWGRRHGFAHSVNQPGTVQQSPVTSKTNIWGCPCGKTEALCISYAAPSFTTQIASKKTSYMQMSGPLWSPLPAVYFTPRWALYAVLWRDPAWDLETMPRLWSDAEGHSDPVWKTPMEMESRRQVHVKHRNSLPADPFLCESGHRGAEHWGRGFQRHNSSHVCDFSKGFFSLSVFSLK